MKSSGLDPSGFQVPRLPLPLSSFPSMVPSLHLSPLCSFSLHVHVKVQHQQLGLFCAVAAAHGAHQLGVGGPDAPHHAATAAALQSDQVSDELSRLQVPKFNRAIVRAGDDKVLVELETCHGALVLVGTCNTGEPPVRATTEMDGRGSVLSL